MYSSVSALPSWLTLLALTAPATAQLVHPPLSPRQLGPVADQLLESAPRARPAGVLFDQPGDGRVWASGTTYKASFGAEGFTYVPFFGAQAPRDYPVRFALRAVRVGGETIQLRPEAKVLRRGNRVVLDRGAVQEIHDLTPDTVEQTVVVATDRAGDVDVEFTLVTELRDDPAQPGLQLGNALGAVQYGTAWLVQDTGRTPIATEWSDSTLRLRVPAALRPAAGLLVIDPVITTRTFAPTLMSSEVPDISYDVTNDRWLVTWVHVFSATDHDVYAELRQADGNPVPGSFRLIDNTTESLSFPRCANLNSVDRFLIAMERIPQTVGAVYSLWGRTMDAGGAVAVGPRVELSPRSGANQNNVDVGGDPGTGTVWTLVWVFGGTIYANQVDASGTVLAHLTPIAATGQNMQPQISLSNGNGTTPTPGYCVVFNRQVSASDWDVFSATLRLDGSVLTPAIRIDTGVGTNDLVPSVSSPFTDPLGRTAYAISYHRVGSATEMIVKVVDPALRTLVPEVNLSQRYGYTGDFYRIESDGLRCAAVCQTDGRLRVGTLALVNNDLIQHEAPQTIGPGGWPFVASKYSGGGGPTDYGIAYVDTSFTPLRVAIATYAGHTTAGGITTRATGCGLGITAVGRPCLGESVQVALPDLGSDLGAILLGTPLPAATVCGSCRLGVDPVAPLLLLGAPLALPIPRDPLLVGGRVALQGFAFGSGVCNGGLRLSHTLDCTLQ